MAEMGQFQRSYQRRTSREINAIKFEMSLKGLGNHYALVQNMIQEPLGTVVKRTPMLTRSKKVVGFIDLSPII
jgi:hypothetical protein